MDSYLVVCDDARLLDEQPQTVCDQFARFLNARTLHFAPVLFAEYSCLTQLVHEEIDLVVSGQRIRNDARLDYDAFIAYWGWEQELDTKVYHLSGGWRKLLGISLFLNRKCDSLLFVDFATHLSDATIAFVVERIGRLSIKSVGFAEFDALLMQKQVPSARRLRQSGARLIDDG